MATQRLPSAWLTAGTKKKVTARVDMSAEVAGKGNCPECKKPMSIVQGSSGRLWACAHDRISLPIPDDYAD